MNQSSVARLLALTCAIVALSATPVVAQLAPAPGSVTYLSDLAWVSASNGWGPVERDRSNGEKLAGDGRTLTLRGTTYAKGLGVHATSDISYVLDGQYTTFLADVGIDDATGGSGSVVFQVWVNGVKNYDSGVVTGTSPVKSVSVDVTGKTTLRLVVTNGGNNINNDHADWANARLLASSPSPPPGLLRVHPNNPRYFTDGSGPAIYLTGSHTWNNIQDHSDLALPGGTFAGLLDWLVARGHNFLRLWMAEHTVGEGIFTETSTISPLPWRRTGPGTALDGQPKFDLTEFDPAYFDRLRQRAIDAGRRGFYVSVMFFDDWSTEHPNAWQGHPFHPSNNVNGVDGDPDADGLGLEFHTLQVPAIVALQDDYVKKVVDTVNDLDHVIYEVANETDAAEALAWQTRLVDLIRQYEASKPKQHLVGMTVGGPVVEVDNTALFDSTAEWISPNATDTAGFDYRTNPRPNDGRKIILSDTDHMMPLEGDRHWVWKSFLRGLHPIFMDAPDDDATRESARRAMGDTLVYARKMNLVAMAPRTDLASTGYTLANPGAEYLVYQPDTGAFTVTLPAGIYSVEWFDPSTRVTAPAPAITVASTGNPSFTPPFSGDAVLYLKSTGASAPSPPPGPATTFLSDLTWVSATNGWGPIEKDRSNGDLAAGDGGPITIRGATYAKGLGVHAASDITYNLGSQYTTFLADVGVDDAMLTFPGCPGSVVFQVWVDGLKRYDSGVVTSTSPVKRVSVNVTGKTTLRLVVTNGGNNNIDCDHADWANARLTAT